MGQEFVVPSFNTNRYYNKNTDSIAVLPTGLTAGMVIYVQSDGTLDGSLNHFWDSTNNRLGIGTATPTHTLEVINAEGSSELVAKFGVSDASGGSFTIINSTGGAAAFSPALVSTGTTTLSNFFVASGTTDTGTNPIYLLRARIGTATEATTRPLFSFQNNSTEYVQIDANANLRVNKAAAYSEPSAATGLLHYNSTGGIMTLASISPSGNTQFNLRTAVGSGTMATRFAIGSTGIMSLTPASVANNLTIYAVSTSLSTQYISSQLTDTSTSGTTGHMSIQYISGPAASSSAVNYAGFFQTGSASANAQNFTATVGLISNGTQIVHRGSGTVTGAAGFYSGGATNSGGGTITNFYGVYLAANTTATNNYGFYNAGATNNVLGTGLTGIGVVPTAGAGALQVSAQAAASAVETIAKFNVTDDSTGAFFIENVTPTDSVMLPGIRGVAVTTNRALLIVGQGTTDTGSTELVDFRARIGTGTSVTSRNLFAWTNNGTERMSMNFRGSLTHTIASTGSLAETLHTWSVSDDATGKFELLNNSATDATFVPLLRGTSASTNIGLVVRGASTTDSGTTAVSFYDSRIGTATAVATRKAFLWANNGTEVMNILGTTAGSALSTLGGRIKFVRSVSSTTITVAVTDHIVLSSTGGGAVAVSLPASPETGREYTIKDNVGDAGTNNITVTPAAGNIDGAATNVINSNYGSRTYVYNGTQWNVI